MSSIKGHRFHPFGPSQTTQIPKSLVLSSSQAFKTTHLQSSTLLNYLGYRFNKAHSVMICVSCGFAVMPGHAIGHVKNKHHIPVTKEQEALWHQTVVEWAVTDSPVPSPLDRRPVELLNIHRNAYCCNCCSYASLTIATFSKHWSLEHREINMPPAERYHDGFVQTFYSHAPCTYFEIDVPIHNSTPLFDVYIKKEVPNYEPFDVMIPSAPREIPPLLYCTRWHEHLAEYITDKASRRELYTLAHPKNYTKCPLWKLVWNYLSAVAEAARNSSIRVRCLLTEYPRTEQKAEPWKYHLAEDTQRTYAYPLHSLVYSVLLSHKGHPSNYKFPLPPDFTQRIVALESCLAGPITADHLTIFHDFIYPLLSSQSSVLEENKWSMVLECWLALYAMEMEGNFLNASQLTGLLAKMTYHCRAVTFYQSYLHRKDFLNDSVYAAVDHYCNLNIRTGGLHPFNTIVEYQRFASALSYANASPPTTTLSSDAKTVTYKDKTLHLDDWVTGLRRAYNDSIALIKHLCRNKDFSLDIPAELIDDMSESSYGYSWVDSVTSIEPAALMKHLMSNTDGDVPCKMGRDEALIWDAAWQLSWMRAAGELNQLMANLHHTVPGQPSRVAELCDFRLRNGLRGRNMFYNHGDIWLITRRVKSESLVQHEEFIPVKLPPELCRLYKLYFLIIRPVEIDFARRLWGQDVATLYHDYLYVMNGARILEDQFYVQFKVWTEKYFKCNLGVRAYRQSVIAVARAYLGTEYELELEEEDDALIKQRGHGAMADRRCYGVQSAYLTTLSSDLMFRFGHMSEWWWRLTQFAPGKAPLLPLDLRRKNGPGEPYRLADSNSFAVVQQPELDSDKIAAMITAGVASALHSLRNEMDGIIQTSVAKGVAEALLRQNQNPGPGFSTALLHQNQNPGPSSSTALSRQNRNPAPSSTWNSSSDTLVIQGSGHRSPIFQSSPALLPEDNSMDIDLFSESLASPNPTEAIDAPVAGLMDVDSGDSNKTARHYLRLFYKGIIDPKFRSRGQEKMVELAFAGKQNFIGVLPTGGGKSLVFLLPAFAATVDTPQDESVKKTLVIIPNRSLMEDTLRKAIKSGISCAQWTVNTNDRVVKDTALILVAIESLASYKFKNWFRNNEKTVTRFVVDECHQIITCDTYRKKFDAVKELAQFPVQKIFITATLPVFLEDYFLQQIYLPPSTQIIREPTNRMNIVYHLLRVEQRVRKAKDVVIDLAKLVERELWSQHSRGIIFCLSRVEVDELAASFGNTKSHSDMKANDRSELQEKWYEGLPGHRWMVATTGFVHGIDHPSVDTVIFLEMPYGLNNFVQGAGRAGRSGSVAHVFLLDYCTTFLQARTGIDSGAVEAGARFVKNMSDCRRTVLSEVMDGLPVCCGDLMGASMCDICDPGSSMAAASKQLLLPVRQTTPDYDRGGWDDATLASLDPHILNPEVRQPLTHAIGSTAVLLDHAIYLKLRSDKTAKVSELTALTKTVGGILDSNDSGYCVICWVWKKKRVLMASTHRYFIDCKPEPDRFVNYAIGWIKLKKEFRFEKYKYCWRCGLPQGDFALSTHPTFKPGALLKCPFDDLVVLLIWYIIHTEDVWARACSAFAGLEGNMSLEALTTWLVMEENPQSFYNGLELVIWYWATYRESLINL